MLNRKINKGEARVHYKLTKYKNKGDYKILEDIIGIGINNQNIMSSQCQHAQYFIHNLKVMQ